jgi:hypothetical protein
LPIAFRLLTILLAATPVLAFSDSASGQDAFAIVTAVILVAAAMAPPSDITATIQLLKGLSLAILFPILFTVFQLAPTPFASLANPIWPTAAAALNEPSLWGHVSLDPGNTLRDLMLYLAVLSLVIATVIITRDRQRAQTTLFILCAMTGLMSAEALLGQLSLFAGIFPVGGIAAATFVAASTMGTLINAAAVVMAVERHLSQREPEISYSSPLLLKLFLGFAGVAICLGATMSLAPANVTIAMAFGLAIILLVVVARRFADYPWSMGVLFLILAAIGIGIVAQRFQNNFSDGVLGFAASASPESLALARRALADSGWLGSGVGTFSSLIRVYQDFGAAPILDPPSTVIGIAVEWGRPALLVLAASAIQLFAFTFRGALRRGRDSLFPAAAAACTAVALFEAFCDPSLMHPPVQIIIAVIVGLGVSQSVGRTSGLQS